MSDIFISYAREDRPNAERLAHVFERQGWTVWWDKVIPPGRRFGDVIAEQLGAAKAVVVLWSRTSAASDWVKDEAQEGAARNVLVSMLVEKVTPPLGFRQFQMGDLSEWDGSDDDPNLQDVLKAVADLIDRPYAPAAVVSPTASPARPTWLYFTVGAALVAALAIAGFWVWRDRGPDPVANNGNVGGPVANNSVTPKPASTGCSRDASQKAADLTGKGLTFIDKDGNHAAAVLQFNEALAECPDYVDAYFYRGQSYAVLGRKERAVGDFNKVVQLSSDPDIDHEAQELIAGLTGAPRPTPTPPRPHPSGPAANTAANNTAPTPAPPTQNTNTTPPRPLNPTKVGDIFAADRGTRINATTRLIIEKKRDPGAVKEAVASALANPENKSGVINTLVYLENVDPAVLKQNRAEIEKLFAVAKDNGPETVKHIEKVRQRLGA